MAKDLFSPFTVGDIDLANRIVMAPMTRSRATSDHVPTSIMVTHYADRAAAGLIITEGTAPDANGAGYARIPGIYSDAQVTAWRDVTDAVHAAGGRIALQLMHTGRVGHPANMDPGTRVLAPSATQLGEQMYTDAEGMQPYPVAEAMTVTDIETTINGYVSAAKSAMAAGFDAIELHGANGYLIDQFIAPVTNLRDDAWGGDIAGRGRFALEVARRVADAIGAGRVGIRLSPFGVFNGIQPWDTATDDFVWLAGELGKLGLAFLHIVDHSAMGAPEVPEEVKVAMKSAFDGPLIRVGGYTRERADADIATGKADLIAFGRVFIANPDLVDRLKTGASLNEPDFSTFYTPGEKGYNDYPRLER